MARDEFSKKTRDIVAGRVGYLCSNPNCRRLTSGPHTETDKSISVGETAHIIAASPGGPRADSSLTSSERKSPANGIWLCATCARLIDTDEQRYSVNCLKNWKNLAEITALEELQRRGRQNPLELLFKAEGLTVSSSISMKLPKWPDHWKNQSVLTVNLYAEDTEPTETSLDQLIDRAKRIPDSDLVRGFTVIHELLHALSDPKTQAHPIIPTDAFPPDLKKCYELCHEIFMCTIVLLRAIGMPYGHIYDRFERKRIAQIYTRLWGKLGEIRPFLDRCEAILVKTSQKSTMGVSAHKTIVASAEFLIRETITITEMNWSVVNRLGSWHHGDHPFQVAPARPIGGGICL